MPARENGACLSKEYFDARAGVPGLSAADIHQAETCKGATVRRSRFSEIHLI